VCFKAVEIQILEGRWSPVRTRVAERGEEDYGRVVDMFLFFGVL
jgi:hypothetical protein